MVKKNASKKIKIQVTCGLTSSPRRTMLWLVLLYMIPICLANTETHLLEIPQYYDIPPHPEPIHVIDRLQRNWHRINSSLSVLLDYPIASISDELLTSKTHSNVVTLPYDSIARPQRTILVRLNNYNDTLLQNKDLLNIKLCWPATLPFDFKLSHEYIKTKEIIDDANALNKNHFDLYLRIDYQFFGVTYNEAKFLRHNDEVKFQLFVSKLPFKMIPIPLELYDFVIYLVDLLILVITQIKFLAWLLIRVETKP